MQFNILITVKLISQSAGMTEQSPCHELGYLQRVYERTEFSFHYYYVVLKGQGKVKGLGFLD